jgi:hypothetical protein
MYKMRTHWWWLWTWMGPEEASFMNNFKFQWNRVSLERNLFSWSWVIFSN